ncbi:DGQHR domain-containing protein [Nocardiopsis sp. CC223A]|uniref:DGQHR domain-containing protein n=1 Tax=Nocardiopsis sp. CC223A TaxID=3044051 RepID=UPI00278C83FB|nr:DGQHR domain-containing protein [Nocardiopsis sp. CC223A]
MAKQDKATVQIAGALCVQRGTIMLQAFTDAITVSNHQKIDIFDPDTNTGYQRAPVTSRVRKAATYYDEKKGRMPNPLLVNVRKQDMNEDRAVVLVDEDQAGYENAVLENGNWIGTGRIEFTDDLELWIYDGQHRVGGLNQLLGDREGYEDFPVPISLTLGLDQGQEMREFYEVNTNAVPVKTDLAWQLLTKMAEDDPELREMLAAEDKDWVTRAYAVVDELEKLDGPWRGRFQEANRRKTKGDGVTIPKPQFARSLKPVLDMPSFKRADAATIAVVINAYWIGIKQVMPEPFEEGQEDYVLQKGSGAVALHRVLPQVVEVVRSNGGRLGQPEGYAEVMKELPTLEGESVDNDGQLTTRSGADFWRVGSVASGFSGDAGRRRLSLLIQSRLPSPAETIQL